MKNISKKKNKKGFTLVEMMVSIFIFSIVMTIASNTFATFLKSYAINKSNQKTLENAQYALNLMEKTIRTSVASTASGSNILDFATTDANMIKLFDNSQSRCIAYVYADQKIKKYTKPTTDKDITFCGDFITGYDQTDLTSDVIKGMKVDGWVSSQGVAGRISVALKVQDTANSDVMNTSMTVSLRDYDPEASPICLNIPDNTTICENDNLGLTTNIVSELVASCTPAKKCEFKCAAGYTQSGSTCVPL